MGGHRALLGETAELLALLKGQMLALVQYVIADRRRLGITIEHALYRGDIAGTKPDISLAKNSSALPESEIRFFSRRSHSGIT